MKYGIIENSYFKRTTELQYFSAHGSNNWGIIYLAAKYKNTQFAVDSLLKEFL